ncbi:MAG: HlyC/CorC family transporter, partial [Myxococcales bacterium]|nr:HlyC/CorC family transporter [Myxococcales bacterium]
MSAGHEGLDAAGVAWRLGLTFLFVFLNGFFVAAEFALVKIRGSRVDAMVTEKRRGAGTIQHIHRHLDRYLSACQLGITLASLILGALGEPAVSVLIVAAAESVGLSVAAGSSWLPIVSIGLAFAVITMLHMTIGEQAPKMWAIRRPEGVAAATAPTLWAFAWVFTPVILAINAISNWLLRLVGLPADSGHEETHDTEEIRSILSLSAGAGEISEREYELTENVFRVTQLEVRHIVVPRADIDLLNLQLPLEVNLQRIEEKQHSRYPICEEGLDTIFGFVHTRDLLGRALRGEPIDLRSFAREALLVPDTMSLADFLGELQAKQAHCAGVLDERGTVIGIAFREDVLEEMVGPLDDEFDEREHGMREISAGVFEAPGRVSLPEVLERLGVSLDSDDDEGEDTLG